MNPCILIAQIAERNGANLHYGEIPGICRITGDISTGLKFDKWVKKTFTDHDYLYPGDIISNEALFCFDEKSYFLAEKAGKEKAQKFRNYSHFVIDGEWKIFTKAQKSEIADILLNKKPELAIISESGQRHLVFKGKLNTWQLEDEIIMPDRSLLQSLSKIINELYSQGFNQQEIITGHYEQYKIMKWDVRLWHEFEQQIKPHRGSPIFDLACFLMQKHDIIEPKAPKNERK